MSVLLLCVTSMSDTGTNWVEEICTSLLPKLSVHQFEVLKRRAWIVRNFLGSQIQNRPTIKKDTAFCLERSVTV